jgi:hypothetical protein
LPIKIGAGVTLAVFIAIALVIATAHRIPLMTRPANGLPQSNLVRFTSTDARAAGVNPLR